MPYFYPDTDLHTELLNQKLTEPFLFLTQEQRRAAKAINYAELYRAPVKKMNSLAERLR